MGEWLDWLDHHAAAVQAVAAVVSLFATLVLVILTGTYVWLTRDLSSSARLETAARAQEDEARRRRFSLLLARVQLLLSELPEVADPTRMRNVTLWGEQDYQALLDLAPSISLRIGFFATLVVENMRWLEDRIRKAKELPVPPRVVLASDEEWTGHMNGAIRAVNDIVGAWTDRPVS